jgi:hypothetical protein
MSTSFDQWQQIHTDRPWGEYPCEDIVAACCRHKPQRGDRGYALDIGCGVGNHLRFLRDEGWCAFGMDVPAAIERCPSSLGVELVAVDLDQPHAFTRSVPVRPYQVVIDNVATCCMSLDAVNPIYEYLTDNLPRGALLVARDFRALPTTHAPAAMRGSAWWRKTLHAWSWSKCVPVSTANAVLWHIEAIR